MMMLDGVILQTRSGRPEYGALIQRAEAIASAYEVPASQTVRWLYVDDKNEAYYEAELAADIPPEWACAFAGEVRDIFRESGGYNGLIIRHCGKELLADDPWWPEEFAAANDDEAEDGIAQVMRVLGLDFVDAVNFLTTTTNSR